MANIIDWIAEKLGMRPQPIVAYVPPSPVPIIPPMATAGTNVSATESASLVSSSAHRTGADSDNRSSLVDGR